MRLYVNEDQFLFKTRAGPVWPLGGLPDGDQSGGDATGRILLRDVALVKIKVAFSKLGLCRGSSRCQLH